MPCYSLRKTIAAISILTALFISPALSQDSAQIIEEIIVEGRYLYADQVHALKTPVPILDVPQSLSIVTELEIKQRGFRELSDIIRYTPGVNSSQGEGHRDSIVFRGMRSTADFYLDGVRDDVEYYRSLYNLEQVEIIRGPNALLFGRGGTGGIVNRVTKKAVFGDKFGSFNAGLDSLGAFDAALDYNQPIGDNSALRINVHADSLDNDRDFYDGSRYGINPSLKVSLGDNTILDISYEYADHERFIDRGIPTQNGRPVTALKNIVFGRPDINRSSLEAHILRAIMSHEFSENLKGNITVQYADYDKSYRNLYPAAYDGTNVTLDGYDDPTQRENLIIAGNLVSEFTIGSIGHTLLLGFEYIDTHSKNLRYNALFSSSNDDQEIFHISRPLNININANGVATNVTFTTDLNNQTQTDIRVTSFLIQDQIDVTEKLKLMLGGRFDEFDIRVDDIDDATSESRKDAEFSPRAGLIFKPQENVSIYASYSESFLPRSGEQFKALSANDARLDPDIFENHELGFKWDIAPDLSFAASYFKSEQNRAVRDSITGEQSEIIGLQIDGFELELKGQMTDKFSLTAGYSNLDGKTETGEKPREIPQTSYSLWGLYEANQQFGVGIGLTYQGESKVTNSATSPILPDYTRIDIAAYYHVKDDTVIQLNIENLTDELYFPHAHSTHQISVGEPLNARLSISKRF
ncbi:MAG: TonB-dependent receptor [Parvibaculales bacterium]